MNRLTLELPTLLAEIDRFSEMGRQLRTSGSADGGSGSWILLGVLIADDYLWELHLPSHERPQFAIDLFLDAIGDRAKVLHHAKQVIVAKRDE